MFLDVTICTMSACMPCVTVEEEEEDFDWTRATREEEESFDETKLSGAHH
jgi:hypothetical protein